MFIVVEGIDNVGKSTLIQNLKNRFNDFTFHALHYSNVKQPTAEKVQEYSTKLYTQMFNLMKHQINYDLAGVICDRSHLGELVYGPMYRNYTGEYVLDIEKKYHDIPALWNNVILITLYDDAENVISRDDGLSFTTDVQKKQNEIDSFINAHNKSTIKNKLLVNVKDYNAEELINHAYEYITNIKK
jgi:thymidylate kinase